MATCAWSLFCDNVATVVLDHPVLGEIPICDRCLRVRGDLT